ncbi:Atu4866 domain-containing protein [Pleomorphomonas diazotrophica]
MAGGASHHRPFLPDDGERPMSEASHPYAGLWVTDDGRIRHELLPNGRYVEARGSRERAYEGRYEVRGDHIDYWDDTGFTADGDFIDGVLHHAGMVLRRR